MDAEISMVMYLVMFICGLLTGSFLNSCIYRIPRGISLLVPKRSFCPFCSEMIPGRHNIPLISFLLLRGRCAECDSKIPLRYPAIELLTGLIFITAVELYGITIAVAFLLPFCSLLLAIIVIDWTHLRIPNVLIIYAIALLFAEAVLRGEAFPVLIHGGISAALLLGIRFSGNAWLGEESLGMGDVKLGLVIGMAIGVPLFLFVLFLASLSGLIFVLFSSLTDATAHRKAIPFGSFLAGCTLLFVLAGDHLNPDLLFAL